MTSHNIDKRTAYRTYTIHILSCVAFLFLPLIASPRASLFDDFRFGGPEMQGILTSFLLILFFYLHYLVLLPQLLYKKRFVTWFAVVIVSFFIVIFTPKILLGNDINKPHEFEKHHDFKPDFRPDENHNNLPPDFENRLEKPPHHDNDKSDDFFRTYQIQESLLKFLFVLALSFLLKTNKFWKESREEKRKAELLFLKSQVNPHFLFNTLNGIYALSIEKSEETSKSIVKLSDLMRYVVSEIDKDEVLLSDEVTYLKNYIDLQRLRFGETMNVRFETSDFQQDTKISPLLFINFVENAFKYGIDPDKISEIEIKLEIKNNDLYFSVKNQHFNKNSQSFQLQKGLENVTRRLELIYPQRHSIKIRNTESEYHIELIINDIQS